MQNWVVVALRTWGAWLAAHADPSGYPPESSIAQIFTGGGSRPGHKVLIPDMPAHIWRTHRAVMAVNGLGRDALMIRYCVPPDKHGKIPTEPEIARVLGISHEAWRKRIRRARKQARSYLTKQA